MTFLFNSKLFHERERERERERENRHKICIEANRHKRLKFDLEGNVKNSRSWQLNEIKTTTITSTNVEDVIKFLEEI